MSFLLVLAACSSGVAPGGIGSDGTDADTAGDSAAPVGEAPEGLVIAISPELPNGSSTMTVVLVSPAVDPQADVVNYGYEWTVDGAARPEISGATVSKDLTEDGQTWSVTVTPSDGVHHGTPATDTVTLGNLPPVAPTIHIEPVAPVPGDTLTLTYDEPASDPNGDDLSTSIQWFENGVKWADRTGLTTDGRFVQGGESFTVQVTVTDGLSDPVVATATVTTPNTPPEIVSIEISPADPADRDDIEVTVETDDADGNSVDLAYAWYRDGVLAEDVGDTDTVPAELTTPGEEWECAVTARDVSDSVTETSDSVTVIPFTGVTLVHAMTLTLDEGGETATGTWSLDLEAHGSRMYGDQDCAVSWAIAAEGASCGSCDYAFDNTYTYDGASAVIVEGCDRLQDDDVGSLTWFDRPSAWWTMDALSMYYGRYSYYSSGINAVISGTGEYYSTAYGRVRSMRYVTTESTDAYGSTVLYSYLYSYTGE